MEPLNEEKDGRTMEVSLAEMHSVCVCVCNFSCKYPWQMAVTRYREPQEAIVAGLNVGRGEQTQTAGPVSFCSQPRERIQRRKFE